MSDFDATQHAINAVKGQALRDLAAELVAEGQRFVDTGYGRIEFSGVRLSEYILTRARQIEQGGEIPDLSSY